MTERLLEKQEHMNERVFNFVSSRYDTGIMGKWLIKVIQKTVDEADVKRNASVLDAGAGTGNLLQILENRDKQLRLFGLDISSEMLSIARKKVKKARFMKLSVMDVEKKFKKNFFDYIFVVDAFHHFPDHERIMRQFHTLLKNNGQIIITDFDFGSVFNYLFHVIEPGNSWIFTKKAMRNLFIESGFSIEKQKKIGLFSVMTVGIKSRKKK
ncbi:MAG: hypothetical protein RL557_700 [archaeon]|jgi:ubiquinone/menaquinone biosynthesis C-methylase UbiE